MKEQGYLLINQLCAIDEMAVIESYLKAEFTTSTRLALDHAVIREFGQTSTSSS